MERYKKQHSSKQQNRYTEEFKHHVCEEFINGAQFYKEVERKYNLSNSMVVRWLRQLGYEYKRPMRLPLVDMRKPSKPKQEDDALINKLKRELEDAKFQAEMYRRIIEKAEQELKVKLTKNTDTK
jgi:transposase-like protein